MEKTAQNAITDEILEVNTCFSGTRQNPNICGSIENINTQNFTPANMILGFINGIMKELYDMSLEANCKNNCKILIGSGNGIRKNKMMIKLVKDAILSPTGSLVILVVPDKIPA